MYDPSGDSGKRMRDVCSTQTTLNELHHCSKQTPTGSIHRVAMDVPGPLTPSAEGYTQVLMLADVLTMYV